jgi:hypothetical protein
MCSRVSDATVSSIGSAGWHVTHLAAETHLLAVTDEARALPVQAKTLLILVTF